MYFRNITRNFATFL